VAGHLRGARALLLGLLPGRAGLLLGLLWLLSRLGLLPHVPGLLPRGLLLRLRLPSGLLLPLAGRRGRPVGHGGRPLQ
jgi:hypothetical protein